MIPHPVNYWHMIVWPTAIGIAVAAVVFVVLALIEAGR